MCTICKKNPATVPDREKMGRPINRICTNCHGNRLKGDIKRVQESVISKYKKYMGVTKI